MSAPDTTPQKAEQPHPSAKATSATRPAVSRHKLANGMVVLVEPMFHAPVVALQAWVRVGAADENKARAAGLAHLHEHMLFKGTARRGVGEIARTIEAQGGEMNAWTSFDETVYHLVLADNALALGIDLLADMLRHSQFDAQELGREIEVVKEEIRRAQDNPGRRLSAALFDLAYQHHGYKHPVLGSMQSVGETDRAKMVAFFREHYRPDNTTLVVCGSAQPAEVVRLVEQHFGDWQAPRAVPPAESTAAVRKTEPAPHAVRLKVLRESVQEARLALAWPGLRARDEDTAALDLFAVLLGSGDSSRLHQALVRPRHLLDAYASSYTPKDPGLLLVGATLRAPHPTADEVLEAVGRLAGEALRLASVGPDPAELEKARTMVLSDAAYSKETMEGQARKRGYFEVTAGDFAHEAAYTAAIRKLDAEAICRVAKHALHRPPCLVVQVPEEGPEDVARLTPEDVEAALRRAQQVARPKAKAGAPQRRLHPQRLGVVREQLPGGPVLLVQKTAGEVVSLRAIAHGGQRAETPQTAGSSTLLANCLAQATHQHPAGVLAAQAAALGGGVSGFAGRNTLGIAAEFIAPRAQEGLLLAYEALWAAKFTDEECARERYAQLERIRSRSDSPGGLAMDLFLAKLFATHPYGLPGLGRKDSLERLDAEALAGLHGQMLPPERVVLALCGPIDPAAAIDQLAEALEAFGPAAPATLQEALRRGERAPAPPRDPAPTEPARLTHPLDKAQAHVVVGSQGVSLTDPDRYALDVLAAALSGQSGRLFVDLRDAKSLAYSLSCSSVEGCDPGYAFVHMACSPDKVEQALAGVHGHLDRLCQTPLEPHELQRAQQVLVGGHAIDLQRSGARAMSLATGELYGLGYDSYATYPGHVMNVSAEDVMQAARTYLHAERRIDVVVGKVAQPDA